MQFDLANKTFKPETDQEWDDYLALVLPVEPGFTRFTKKGVVTTEQTSDLVLAETKRPRNPGKEVTGTSISSADSTNAA